MEAVREITRKAGIIASNDGIVYHVIARTTFNSSMKLGIDSDLVSNRSRFYNLEMRKYP